jgi:hypothetical protein
MDYHCTKIDRAVTLGCVQVQSLDVLVNKMSGRLLS